MESFLRAPKIKFLVPKIHPQMLSLNEDNTSGENKELSTINKINKNFIDCKEENIKPSKIISILEFYKERINFNDNSKIDKICEIRSSSSSIETRFSDNEF